MSLMPNNEQITFILRSFDPTYQILLDNEDCITSIDNELKKLLSISSITFTDSEALFDFTFYDLLSQNSNNSVDFVAVLKHNMHLLRPCFIALNSDVTISTRLAIPCIYLYIVIPTIVEDNIKILKFYNLLDISKKLQKIFAGSFLSTMHITSNLNNNLKIRSVYFAYEALKSLSCFAPTKQITSTSDSGIFLSEILKPFHCRSVQSDDKVYRTKLFRSGGYIEQKMHKSLSQISEELRAQINELSLIPYNQLTQNLAIGY